MTSTHNSPALDESVSLEKLAELSAKATPGPWERILSGPQAAPNQVWHDGQNAFVCECGDGERDVDGSDDAAFILASATYVRQQLALVSRSERVEGDKPVKAIKESRPVNVREWALRYGSGIASKHLPNASFEATTGLAADIAASLQAVFDMQEQKFAAAPKATQPEAAASGDVALENVERLVVLYGHARAEFGLNNRSSPDQWNRLHAETVRTEVELLTATRSLAVQARAQALEEAAKVAEGEVYEQSYRTWSFWSELPHGGRPNHSANAWISQHSDEIAKAIRALIPHPSAQAECSHEWVNADNEHVSNSALCLKCGTLTARDALQAKGVWVKSADLARQLKPGSTQGGETL